MAWGDGLRNEALALCVLLAGCASFVEADSSDGGAGSSGSSSGGGTTSGALPEPSAASADGSASDTPATSSTTTGPDSDTTPDPSDPPLPTDSDPVETGSTDGTTGSESTTGGDASASGVDPEETGGDTTGPMQCQQDDEEPNGMSSEAVALGVQGCGASASAFSGTLETAEDDDWFTYDAPWTCGSANNPNHVINPTEGVSACWFPLCNFGSEQINCIAGTPVPSAVNVQGCCSGDIIIGDLNCSLSSDESSQAYIAVYTTQETLECVDYEVSFQVLDE